MEKFISFCITIFILLTMLALMPTDARAECTLSHEECHNVYTCFEYYPNGTDCRKTVKTEECHTVCDEFSVKKSGDTTEHQHLNRDTASDNQKDNKEKSK